VLRAHPRHGQGAQPDVHASASVRSDLVRRRQGGRRIVEAARGERERHGEKTAHAVGAVLERLGYIRDGAPQHKAAGLREMMAPSGIVISEMYHEGLLDDLAPAQLAEMLSWFACDIDRRRYNRLQLPVELQTLRSMAMLAFAEVSHQEERQDEPSGAGLPAQIAQQSGHTRVLAQARRTCALCCYHTRSRLRTVGSVRVTLMPAAPVRPPRPEDYLPLLDYADCIVTATVAPELPGAEAFVRACRGRGVRCNAGHSHATFEQVEAAVGWGVRHVDHLFCAMSDRARLRQTQPYPMRGGLLEATLFFDELTTEVIADGKHLERELLLLAYKVKGPDRLALVTDCNRALDMPDGAYLFGPLDGGDIRSYRRGQ